MGVQQPIEDLADPRLEPFREIRNRNWTELSGWFIAEGPLLVESLLASDYACQSLLLDRKFLNKFGPRLPESVEVLLVDHAMMQDIVGYHFHRGLLGCGLRKPKRSVQDLLAQPTLPGQTTLAACIGIQDPENLGGILRSCAALGVAGVVLGPGCADPLGRRALRVAMGTTLELELWYSRDFLADLDALHSAGINSYATSLAADALALPEVRCAGPAILLFGNERHGLPPEVQKQAQNRLRIEMDERIDSFNVGVAAGITLHYFTRILNRD